MTSSLLLLPIAVSFLITLLLMPFWICKARQINLLWEDMNKHDRPRVPGSGGIIVLLGFIGGTLAYVAYKVFYLSITDNFLVEIFALMIVILLVSFLGLVDDLLGWKHGGLSRRSRLAIVAFSAIPLIAINAGVSEISLPFFEHVELGLLYPLILVPLGIVGATTTFNFLAGFNGLEAGQGILLLSALGLVAYKTGNGGLAVIAFCMVAALLAFLFYNIYPARVFPGDSLTYAVGGLIAVLPILGNFEKIAVFFFIPYILEVGLKIRGKLVKYSFGKPKNDGILEMPYEKFYSLNHIAIWFLRKIGARPTEQLVVISIWAFQLIIILLGLVIFKQGLFSL